MSKRTITVIGKASLAVKPDVIAINMTLESKDKDYETTVSTASEQINALRAALRKAGFNADDLKTTDFGINTEYESVHENNGWSQRFAGYSCRHHLRLEFENDMKRLNKAVCAISSCGSAPQFEIVFSVKNKDEVASELLTEAVANAHRNAKVLADAAGVFLGGIVSIKHEQNDFSFHSQTKVMRAAAFGMNCDAAPEITPEDIKMEDRVEIVWAIEKFI